jgi:hypothetical protein
MVRADLLDPHNPANDVGKFDLDLKLSDGNRLLFMGLVGDLEGLDDRVSSAVRRGGPCNVSKPWRA